jgi:hypothetical protein
MSNRYDDLVLHLKLDDIDIKANTVSDSSNSKLSAAIEGADLVADDTFGACLNFDEQNDQVEVSNVGLSGVNPAHTIEGWIKVEAYPKAKSWIALLGQAGVQSHHWLLNAESADSELGKKAQLGVWGDLGKQATRFVPLAKWVHIAATYDGSNLACYLDGHLIDKPKAATFNLTDKRLTLAKRGIATEKNFQGKMAHVRVYRRALSEGEIRDDMDSDKLALLEYRRGHPIAFSLRDEDENYVLYIGDDPRDHHRLNLELRNTSAQPISFQKKGDTAKIDNHHFELVFRNGVLSDKTLNMLRENKDRDRIVPEKNTDAWDVFSPGEDNHSGTVSVYFLYKDTSKVFGFGQRLIVPLRKISANAGSGARGTRVELKLNQLTYVNETTPITGNRIQHLQIISHLGSRRAPLHVGFVGSNRILNDGSSENTLVLQLMNVLKSEGDTSGTYTTLTSAFTMPAVNGTAVASVASGGAAQFNVGGIVYLPPIGYLNVTAVNTASNQLTLQNLGYSVNQAPGSVAPSGNTLLTKDSEASVKLTKDSEFLISFDVQSASENAPWSLCTEREIEGVKGSIIVAKTDGRYVVIDRNGDAVSDDGRWKVDSTGHGQGETPVWSIKPLQDIVLGHDDYIQIYISKIKTSLPSGPTNLYLDYRKIPGFWDGQVVCPIEKAPLLFYDVTLEAPTFSVSQRVRDFFRDIPLGAYSSSEERDRLVKRLEEQHQYYEANRASILKDHKIALLDGQLEKEAEHFFNEWKYGPEWEYPQRVAEILPLLTETASKRYIQLLDGNNKRLYVSPDIPPGTAMLWLPADQFQPRERTISLGGRDFRMGIFSRQSVPLRLWLFVDMVEIEKYATEEIPKDTVEYFTTVAELLNELATQKAQLQYTGELRVGIGCVKPKAKLEIALSAKDADTKALVIRKGEVNYLTVLKDGYVGIGKGKEEPKASLDVNGEIRANYFRAFEGATERFSVGSDVLINSKVGIGTSSPGAKLSIIGGLHVGGESDPGDKNLLVGGKATIVGGLHVGGESDPGEKNLLVGGKATIVGGLHVGGGSYPSDTPIGVRLDAGDKNLFVNGNATIMGGRHIGVEGDPFKVDIISSNLVVNGSGFFFGNLDVVSQIRFMHHPAKHFVAYINVASILNSGNYYLVFRTWRDAKLHESVTVHPPGGHEPTLAVAGHISEQLDVIDVKGRDDWDKSGNHPIMEYFSQHLSGKPVGTMLRAITNHRDWKGYYWKGWVDADRKIRVDSNNRNTPYIAP